MILFGRTNETPQHHHEGQDLLEAIALDEELDWELCGEEA